ncbi:MAG: hypothetical protein L0229_06645 [Blastocatellia bacterium]|nr:hypothetical protein [Blastocatellia bacterium]
MKRHPALFAAIVLMAFPAISYSQRDSAQSKKTDRERYHFLGPVELVRDEWVTFSDKPDEHGGYVELDRVYMGIRVFDIDGKMVFSHPPLYGPCIRSTQKVPAYDDKGNMIEEITYDDLSGSFLSKAIFKYDENGNRTESAYYGPDGLSFIRRYDAKGREIEEASYKGCD